MRKNQDIYQQVYEIFMRYLEDFWKHSNNRMVYSTSCDSGIPWIYIFFELAAAFVSFLWCDGEGYQARLINQENL